MLHLKVLTSQLLKKLEAEDLFWGEFHYGETKNQNLFDMKEEFPRYQKILSSATEQRQLEFLAGRRAAQIALEAFGSSLAGTEVLRGPMGEPLWPKSLVGSISHRKGFALAVLGEHKHWRALGVDTQDLISDSKSASILSRITTDTERAILEKGQTDLAKLSTWVFSAKESVYKALSALHLQPTPTTVTSVKIDRMMFGEEEEWAGIFTYDSSAGVLKFKVRSYWVSENHLITLAKMPSG